MPKLRQEIIRDYPREVARGLELERDGDQRARVGVQERHELRVLIRRRELEELRVEGPHERTSGWSSKASEAELKGVEGGD